MSIFLGEDPIGCVVNQGGEVTGASFLPLVNGSVERGLSDLTTTIEFSGFAVGHTECVHLAGAGAWSKYDLAGYADAFLGGVVAFHPDDFARCNGFPNDYWGWGLEDDQLRLRAAASGVRVVRPPAGAGRFDDLDELALLGALNRPAERARKRHLLNERFLELRGAPLPLDSGWRDENGLRGLRYAHERRAQQLTGGVRCLHVLVELG